MTFDDIKKLREFKFPKSKKKRIRKKWKKDERNFKEVDIGILIHEPNFRNPFPGSWK